jgi:hypothetical protein
MFLLISGNNINTRALRRLGSPPEGYALIQESSNATIPSLAIVNRHVSTIREMACESDDYGIATERRRIIPEDVIQDRGVALVTPKSAEQRY